MWDIQKEFNANGYVIIEDFLTLDEVAELKSECGKLVENMPEEASRTVFSSATNQQGKDQYFLDSADKISYFYEAGAVDATGKLQVSADVSLNKIGHALHDINPLFRKVTFDERVKECCFQLGFEQPVVVQSMYLFKNPGIGSEVIAHQDASYLHTDPIKILGFWIALEDATLQNGCLWFLNGSHKGGVHRRYVRNPEKDAEELLVYTSPAPHYQKNQFTAAPVKKGTCILIHGQVVHYSEANKSDKSRHAYTFHVIDENNTKYSEDNWLQLPDGCSFMKVYKNWQ